MFDQPKASSQQQDSVDPEKMPLWLALAPILILVALLTWNVYVFGDDALSGSTQLTILAVAAVSAAIGLWRGVSWETQQKQIVTTTGTAIPPIVILLLVGSMASIWLLSGTVPTLIYYGLQLLNPSIFLFACTIVCALTSVVSGSSWSTAATIGVAMVGIGRTLGIPEGLIAGAIISGAYFGDKISPLSDTTNLAAGVTETPVFDHIRYLFLTTGPSMLVSATLFMLIGLGFSSDDNVDVSEVLTDIDQTFNVSIWLLLPIAVVLGLILRKTPAIPSMVAGIVIGLICTLIFQVELLRELSLASDSSSYQILTTMLYAGMDIPVDNEVLRSLFSASGMAGMLGTVWLILSAMVFAGVIEASGMLSRILVAVKSVVNSFFSLVCSTVATCLVSNVSTSDQYISVAMPGRMYVDLYKKMGYDTKNLSRTLEDTGTVTSVLIPWNTCGAYHAAVLGIGTLTYLPYCFFNLLSPLMTLIFAYAKIKIATVKPQSG